MRRGPLTAGAVAALACVAVAAAPAGAAPAKVRTVVSGLDNPRDLAFGPGRRLYVAEAGHGGAGHCISDPEAGTLCFGFTSRISAIDVRRGTRRTVVSGLVSNAAPDGTGATGVDGIAFGPGRTVYGIITGSPDAIPAGAFASPFERRVKRQSGLLIAVRRHRWTPVANVGHRNYVWTSQHPNLVPGQFPDANPYGVLALSGRQYVVDAGANTINLVDARGRVHLRKFIPNPPASDAVPTCIDRGPDGALYIGELTGGGNGPGAARVWRYVPRTNRLSVWARGLTAVTGCGFDHRGRFYAVEFSTQGLEGGGPGTGALVRVRPHSSKPVIVVGGLNFPGGFAAGPHGALYLSNWSILPADTHGGPTGEVLQVIPRS